MGKSFLLSRLKMILEHMIIFKEFQQVKEMIVRQLVY